MTNERASKREGGREGGGEGGRERERERIVIRNNIHSRRLAAVPVDGCAWCRSVTHRPPPWTWTVNDTSSSSSSSAYLSCQGVSRSAWDTETSAPGRRTRPSGAPSTRAARLLGRTHRPWLPGVRCPRATLCQRPPCVSRAAHHRAKRRAGYGARCLCWARAPSGSATCERVVPTDRHSFVVCQ